MFQFFFAIFMALSCPAHNHSNNCQHSGTVTTQDAPPDTGGDDGHVPPKPPKP